MVIMAIIPIWPFTFLISSKREYCSTLVRRPVQQLKGAHAPHTHHTHIEGRHICHSSASFDLIITINLYQEQVTVLLRFKTTPPVAICSLSGVNLTLKGNDACVGANVRHTVTDKEARNS